MSEMSETTQEAKILKHKDITLIMMFGKPVRVCVSESEPLICAEDLLDTLYKNERYYHLKQLRAIYAEAAIFEEDGKPSHFFTFSDFAARFMEYKVQTKTYQKQPDRYKNYMAFISFGGFNWVVKMIERELGNSLNSEAFPVPSISHLKNAKPLIKEKEKPIQAVMELLESEEQDKPEPQDKEVVPVEKVIPEPLGEAKEEVPTEKAEDVFNDAINERILEIERLAAEDLRVASDKPIDGNPVKEVHNESKLRTFLMGRDIYLWATLFLIVCLLPFTISAILKYNGFVSETWWQSALSYAMCIGIAISWDFSILVFTVKGKDELANMGSFFQMVFFSVHFDLISKIFNMMSLNGDKIQEITVTICIVAFSAILVNQFSNLSKHGSN